MYAPGAPTVITSSKYSFLLKQSFRRSWEFLKILLTNDLESLQLFENLSDVLQNCTVQKTTLIAFFKDWFSLLMKILHHATFQTFCLISTKITSNFLLRDFFFI